MEKLTASQVLARNRAERSRAEPTSGDPLLCAGVFALRASAKPWKDSDVSAAVQSDSMPSPEGCLSRTEHEPLPNMWCRQAAVAPYDVASAALTAGDFLFLFLSYSSFLLSFSLYLFLSLSLSVSLCLSLSLPACLLVAGQSGKDTMPWERTGEKKLQTLRCQVSPKRQVSAKRKTPERLLRP